MARACHIGNLVLTHIGIAQLACRKFELAQGAVVLRAAVEVVVLMTNLARHKLLPRLAWHTNGTVGHIAKGSSLHTLLFERLSKK